METLKCRLFISEPMGEKNVTEIDGIGQVFGNRLGRKGFKKAYTLLGQFLLFKKNKQDFTSWLDVTFHITEREAIRCSECLQLWCDAFL